MNTKVTEPVSTADREIIATRVFDASRESVFDMWTDAKHLEQR